MRFNLPTCFTLFRILLIPFFVLAFYLPVQRSSFVCAMVFVLAAITDWFDGFLARRMKQTTRFGAFLDPVADKIMVIVALALVVEYYHSPWITLPALIMMVREIIISALREWMAELGKRTRVSVSSLGKWKTAAQMTALIILLWHPAPFIEKIGIMALYIATGLTFWSMFFYLKMARADLTER